MKLINYFHDFMKNKVNLNRTRIENLESSVDTIKAFIKDSHWEPRVWRFIEQGSWAHNTIIKPRKDGEFDADLLVIVDHVEGWNAEKYIRTLGALFKSSNRYSEKVNTWNYCVTITYKNDRKIDISPCIRGRIKEGQLEICSKYNNLFISSNPTLYTDWFNEKNKYSGQNSFRKATRIIKYLRDNNDEFRCKSFLLTTLIGEQINWNDQFSSHFSDVPTAFKTIISRLDIFLQSNKQKPRLSNPSKKDQNLFDLMSNADYAALREYIHKISEKIKDAYEETNRFRSIALWQDVLGKDFASGVSIFSKEALDENFHEEISYDIKLNETIKRDASHGNYIVEAIQKFGNWVWKPSLDRPAHMVSPIWGRSDTVSDQVEVHAVWKPFKNSADKKIIKDFDILQPKGGISFDVTINDGLPVPEGYFVRYRVTNTGSVAMSLGKGRGGFEAPQTGNTRWEELQFTGVHLVEAFIIKHSDDKIVGQSPAFHVVIR